MPPRAAPVAASSAAPGAGTTQSDKIALTSTTGHTGAPSSLQRPPSSAVTTRALSPRRASAACVTPAPAAKSSSAAALLDTPPAAPTAAPRASPRLAQKVKRSERALAEETVAMTVVAANPAPNAAAGLAAPPCSAATAAAAVVAAAAAASLPASNMPLLRSASTLMSPPSSTSSPALSSASRAAAALLPRSPATSSAALAGSPGGAGVMSAAVTTPLSKLSSSSSSSATAATTAASNWLFATPSPISLPSSSLVASAMMTPNAAQHSTSVRRKLLGSGSGSGSSSSANDKPLVCVGLPPSPSNSFSGLGAEHKTRNGAAYNKMPPPSSSATSSPIGVGGASGCGELLVRAHSCGAAVPSYHKPLLPSYRQDGVDFVSPRNAALLLLAQRGRIGAGDHSGSLPSSCTSEQAAALLGPLTAAEQSSLSEWRAAFDRVLVLDARFEYEFDGGHIAGAVNVTSHSQAEDILVKSVQPAPVANSAAAAPSTPSPTTAAVAGTSARTGSRVCVLIHCEFSKKRGPKCWLFLRQRDRMLNQPSYPALHFPEMYVIAGGYLAFFSQNPATISMCAPAPSSPHRAPAVTAPSNTSASVLAHSLCAPVDYVSMTDRRHSAAYAAAWQRMKKSSATPQPMSQAFQALLLAQGIVTASPRHSSLPSSSEAGGGSGGGGAKNGGTGAPPRSRGARVRHFSEMDGRSSPCSNSSAHNSPALMQRSLSLSSPFGVAAPMNLNSCAVLSPPTITAPGSVMNVPAPRPNRGLTLQLDSASIAPAHAAAAAAAAASGTPTAAAGSGASLPRRAQSAFSFNNNVAQPRVPPPPPALQISMMACPSTSSFSSAASSAAPSLSQGVATPQPLSSPSSSSASAPPSGSPSLHSFGSGGSGVVGFTAPSPSPTYGWSTEDRTSTPSPAFFPESPRVTSAPSPLPVPAAPHAQQQHWWSPSLHGHSAATAAANAILPQHSPRTLSLQQQLNPPTFTKDARAAAVAAAQANRAHQSSGGYVSPFSFGAQQQQLLQQQGFTSPSQSHSRRMRASPASASAGCGDGSRSNSFGGGSRSQSMSLSASASASSLAAYSPSSLALHRMHLRAASPSLSQLSSSACICMSAATGRPTTAGATRSGAASSPLCPVHHSNSGEYSVRSDSTPSPSVMRNGSGSGSGGASGAMDESSSMLLVAPDLGVQNALSSADGIGIACLRSARESLGNADDDDAVAYAERTPNGSASKRARLSCSRELEVHSQPDPAALPRSLRASRSTPRAILFPPSPVPTPMNAPPVPFLTDAAAGAAVAKLEAAAAATGDLDAVPQSMQE